MSKASDPPVRNRNVHQHIDIMREHMRDMYAMYLDPHADALMDDCIATIEGQERAQGRGGQPELGLQNQGPWARSASFGSRCFAVGKGLRVSHPTVSRSVPSPSFIPGGD